MSAAVLSVEKFSLAMPGATVSTPALSKGQDIDNCVPFITVSSDIKGNDGQLVDVVKNGGTDKFDFSTGSAVGTRNLEVAIVEFDPAQVKVQEKAFTLTGSGTANVTVTAVVEANTFALVYSKMVDTLDDYNDCMISATFTSTTNLRLQKLGHSSNNTGHAYILEALDGAWAIETGASILFIVATTTATFNTTISVVPSRTGLWMSWRTAETTDDVRDGVWDATITDATNIDGRRGHGATPSAACNIENFVVNFAEDVAGIQQGEFDYLTATTKTAAINAPGTLANTMIVGSNALGWMEGSGTGSLAKEFSQGRMSFNSATEVLGTRDGTGNGNYRQYFQVIEWLIASVGGAAQPTIIHIGF